MTKKIEVDNYGDVLAFGLGKKLLAYKEFGSYQGDYIAILEDGDNVEIYKGSYGSCGGCDWLQNETDYDAGVSEEKIKDYVEREVPFLVILKSTLKELTEESIEALLPKNSRIQSYDDISYKDLVKLLKSI